MSLQKKQKFAILIPPITSNASQDALLLVVACNTEEGIFVTVHLIYYEKTAAWGATHFFSKENCPVPQLRFKTAQTGMIRKQKVKHG